MIVSLRDELKMNVGATARAAPTDYLKTVYFNHFPKEKTLIVHCTLSIVHCLHLFSCIVCAKMM